MKDREDFEALVVSDLRWIGDVARRLAPGEAGAEDLAQEACLAALQGRPAPGEGLRGWLATVLRRGAFRARREEGRRRDRELLAAVRAEAGDPAEGAVDAVRRREVVDLVLRLDEPYRSTVLLRFLEELEPREIAERTGVPLNTVKTRLARGLARLRERMGGEPRRELGALALLVARFRRRRLPRAGAAGAPAALAWTSGIAALAVAALWLRSAGAPERRAPERVALRADAPQELGAPRALAAGPAASEAPRRPVPPMESSGASPARPIGSPPPALLRGVLLDGDARPLAGLRVRAGAGSEGASDDDGAFELRADEGAVASGAEPGWATVLAGTLRAPPSEAAVVLAPARRVAGEVRDAAGRAVEGAWVEQLLPRDFAARFARSLASSEPVARAARTDERGRFALEDAPSLAGARLAVRHDGFARTELALPEGDVSDLLVALPLPPSDDSVPGRVVLADGATPAAGALVWAGPVVALADDDGRFALERGLVRALAGGSVAAAAPGSGPAFLQLGGGDPPAFLELRLAGPPRELSGTVVDGRGEPVAGAEVWLENATPFGAVGGVPVELEAFCAGAPFCRPLDTGALAAQLGAGPERRSAHYVWSPDEPTATFAWAVTDARGRFELRGLRERPYRVVALDPRTLACRAAGPFAPGSTDARIELPDPAGELAGSVRDGAGRPRPGARVRSSRWARRAGAPTPEGPVNVTLLRPGPTVATDADGEFRLPALARDAVLVTVEDPGALPRTVDAPREGELALVLDVPLLVKVELAEPWEDARVAARDAAGASVRLVDESAGLPDARPVFELVAGRSPVLAVPPSAVELVLLAGAQEVERVPLAALPGELQVVVR